MTHQAHRWENYRDQCRTEWQHTNPNRTWDDVEHGYRYGWESALNERYQGRAYTDVESDLQRGWSDYDRNLHTSDTSTQLEHTWEDFKDSARHGWERAKQQFRDTF